MIEINKNSKILKKLKEIKTKGFTASMLINYIRNPISFYYQTILEIPDENQMEETIAYNTLGSVIHNTLEDLYKPLENKKLNEKHIKQMQKEKDNIVDKYFQEKFSLGNLTKGKNLIIVETAKKYIDKLLIIKKNNYEFLRDKAYIEYLNNDYLMSEKYINEALNQNSEEVFGLNVLGLLYLKKDEILNAINLFKKAILINPQYSDSYNNLGKCYIDLEKLSLAYLNFKKSYKINPNSELPLINIANILSLKDKNKLAIKFYEKANDYRHVWTCYLRNFL